MISTELHEGMLPPPKVFIQQDDIMELKKVLNWVDANPGCHPENIRQELLKLKERFSKY